MPKTTIVTAIPYVNSTPHIGNILTTLSGDVTARYLRMRGEDVFSVAGTDENGLKIKEAAESQGRDANEFTAEIAQRFIEIFDGMNMKFDKFVRTSLPEHREASQALFRKLQENGFIYTATYEGWYDVSTETYFKEADLVDGKSPDGNEVRWVSEENYFFKLSAFGDRLLAHIETNPDFIIPETRKNEVVSFIKSGLMDQCVSRKNNGWGIPVPGDESQVIYVWFDALINYITATGWPNPGWEDKWPALAQWLGKDILTRFHATLWPAMLMGADLPLPKHVIAHAWILLGSEKISKSKGNVVRPLELAAETAALAGCSPEVAVDVVRYYITATMGYENDSTFTYEDFHKRYNSDLANDLGNALNRSLAMAHKFVGGIVPDAPIEAEVLEAIQRCKDAYETAMAGFRLERAANAGIDIIRFVNKYVDTRAPWALAKAGDESLAGVLRSMILCVRTAEGLLRPFMPTVCNEVARQLGVAPSSDWNQVGTADSLPVGTLLSEPQPIFPRIDLSKVPAPPKPEKAKPEKKMEETKKPAEETTGIITIDDFAKVQLRVGRVFEAEPLEGSDKLLKLQVHIGEEKRQIVAGIRANYTPEDLIGRQVVVVYNLKPAKLRGTESQGMLLAATDENGGAILLQPDREAPEGTQVR
ncbi:MAG: methionine--tRNA ligase [Armatimonadetes bacterium Cent15-Ar3]|nr:MAG: methionine--tRNA ligase [Armatimonadetes bacterium Cent15-Ar3]